MSRQLQLLTHHKETKIHPWTPLIHAMANDFYKASSRRWIQEARGLTSFITALLWIGLLLLLVFFFAIHYYYLFVSPQFLG
jgi:hypothetical protein